MKIVINTCYGGFNLSEKACDELGLENGYDSIKRNDPKLIKVIEKLGKDANGKFANLKVIEIPDDVDWVVEEYDGNEWIAEKHRVWR